MPTRGEVKALVDQGHSYETAGRALGIPAGLAFMIATGLPADGSDSPSPEQELVNPPRYNPTRKEHVMAWVWARAARDLKAEG